MSGRLLSLLCHTQAHHEPSCGPSCQHSLLSTAPELALRSRATQAIGFEDAHSRLLAMKRLACSYMHSCYRSQSLLLAELVIIIPQVILSLN
jgi:hypothetical protein